LKNKFEKTYLLLENIDEILLQIKSNTISLDISGIKIKINLTNDVDTLTRFTDELLKIKGDINNKIDKVRSIRSDVIKEGKELDTINEKNNCKA